jgi:hypothetical protein
MIHTIISPCIPLQIKSITHDQQPLLLLRENPPPPPSSLFHSSPRPISDRTPPSDILLRRNGTFSSPSLPLITAVPILNVLARPLGRSAKVGARGFCLPLARPPKYGISYVAARAMYRTRSYTMRINHGPMVRMPKRSWRGWRLNEISQCRCRCRCCCRRCSCFVGVVCEMRGSVTGLTKNRMIHVSTTVRWAGRMENQDMVGLG